MAKQANRMMIGGFVVIAVFLLAASVVIFGSGKFFKTTQKFVLHFEGSIKGLNVGAPVLFQGVQIGSITSIVVRTSDENLTMSIPVIIEIEQDRFQVVDKLLKPKDISETLPILIGRGLRAVLSVQSLITGQLVVELDYFPDTPVKMREKGSEYLEIPTIPSTTQRLFQTLQSIDFKGLADHLENTMAGVDTFVNNPDWGTGLRSLKVVADELRDLIGKIDARIESLLDNVEGTLSDSRKLINNVDRNVEPMADDLKNTIEDFDNLTQNAKTSLEKLTNALDSTLTGFRGVVSEDAPLVISLEDALRDVSAMASAMRQLANYLEQHPEALIQGKGGNGGK
jgi:paraquat-inducible protein B